MLLRTSLTRYARHLISTKSIMGRIPQGWTEDKLKHATVDDLRQLPEDTLHEIDQHVIEDVNAMTVVVMAQIAHNKRVQREAVGLPPAPPGPGPFHMFDAEAPKPVDPVVQVVEEAGWDDFGYLLFRVDYSDDSRWERWEKAFGELLDRSIEAATGGEQITDKCLVPINDDPSIDLDSFSEVQRYYKEVAKSDGDVPVGLDHGYCLAADDKAVESLLEPKEGVEPWVWLIDEHYDFSQIDSIADDEYPGHFPVAISSLIPDLFPLVARSAMTGRELWACCSFDERHPVWTSSVELN